MKKFIALTLSFIMMFSIFCMPVNAAAENKQVPAFVDFFEKTFGDIISVCTRYFNSVFDTDAETVPAPVIREENYEVYDGEIDFAPEMILEAETWVCNEITFESEKTYADPFNDVDVDLILYGNGKKYTIPGFWYGENVWKIRFVCPEAGEWYFETVCTDESNSSLHNKTGKVNCKKYSGDLDIYKHGFITTRYGEKYFTYDDGTPFFYLGDTHWSLGEETVDMVKTICEKRVSQGFTVIQSEPIGAAFDFGDGIAANDIQGLAVYDEKFSIIAENGLVHANAEFFFPYSMELIIRNFGGVEDDGEMTEGVKTYLEKISRYWVARYSAYPVLWTLGQEVDNDFYWSETNHVEWSYINNPYKLVADYIAKYDPYTHPLTAHQENTGETAAYGNGEGAPDDCKVYHKGAMPSCFRDVASHDFYAAQWTPSKTGQIDFNIVKDFWYNSQGKPVVNYEGQYCYLWTKNFGARMQGWTAYLNGMYGYGWGGHDTWSYLNIYDEENDSSDGVDTITSEEKKNATWQDSLEYASSYQSGYMKTFLETTEWYNLIPRFGNKAYFNPCLGVYYSCASNEDNTEIVIYFYSFTDENVAEKDNTISYGGFKTGTVGNLIPDEKYTLQWFDPINGEFLYEEEFTASSFGTYYIGERPDDTDMALVIRKG
ncbi:MAG: DUF4038 domain-containing protein [Ruminococcaceae bacterium]|nr:DUF4038 domain-containing protein [Oscillospiraceae bacterium]